MAAHQSHKHDSKDAPKKDRASKTQEPISDTHTEKTTKEASVASDTKDANDCQEMQEALARSQADYQNLLMRVERDKREMLHYLSSKILLPILGQLDHLTRAIKIKEAIQGDAFVDGVRAVHAGLLKSLEMQHVMPFVSIGKEVDPDRHEVLSQTSGPEGIIVQEFETGYLLDGKVLRHAKVVVGNGEK